MLQQKPQLACGTKSELHQHIKEFHQLERNFFSLISFNKTDLDDLTLFATGVEASGLNPVIVHQVNELFASDVAHCHAFYQQHQLPWALLLPDYLHNDYAQSILTQHQMNLCDEGVAMALSLTDVQVDTQDSPLTIKEINTDLPTWSIPLIHGFESTPEITEIYTARHQHATKPGSNLHHFSGFLNDTIVCSLTLSLLGDSARLDDVATMPEYQNKGYATALIYKALSHLKQLQVQTCYLEASTSGHSIYARIGFKELFKNFYYEYTSN